MSRYSVQGYGKQSREDEPAAIDLYDSEKEAIAAAADMVDNPPAGVYRVYVFDSRDTRVLFERTVRRAVRESANH